MLPARGITLSAEYVRLSGSRPGRARQPSCPRRAALPSVTQNWHWGSRCRGWAKHVAQFPFLPEGRRPAPRVSRGPLTVAFGARAQAGPRRSLECYATTPRHARPSETFHTTEKGSSVWSAAPKSSMFLTNLTLHFPRPFAAVWNGAVLLARSQTSCHPDQWAVARAIGYRQVTPSRSRQGSGTKSGLGHRPPTWARRNVHLPRARGPMALSE